MSNANVEAVPTYSGDLFQVSIPKLLFHFFASGSNGRLTLSQEKTIKEMYLAQGRPIAVLSNLPHEHLSNYLFGKGILTPELLKKVLAETDNQDDRVGDAILRENLMSSHELFEHLRRHVLEKIYDLFRWRTGQYAFYQGQTYAGIAEATDLDPWQILTRRGAPGIPG